MAKKFCISCGEQKKLTWRRRFVMTTRDGVMVKRTPAYCTMRCAADAFDAYAASGPWEAAHCRHCGQAGDAECDHGDEA